MKKNFVIIFIANAFMLLSGVVTSLLTAWALGPEGRGNLAVVVLWPNVVALLVGLGLPQAHRYYLARQPESRSMFFSNALVFALVVGLAALLLAELIVPHLVGVRSPEVMWLVRIYLVNIPLALLYDLMVGCLEGARQFGWVAAARGIFFGVQSVTYLALWSGGHLTVRNAAFTMIAAQVVNTLTAVIGVIYALRPRWNPGWLEWKQAIDYGVRYHPGVVTAFTTLRLDQLLLGGMASSSAIGLYVIAVRLSEITTVLASSVADVLLPEVAACQRVEESIELLTRSLRRTIYTYLLVLLPLWVGTPVILRVAYGQEFLAAAWPLRLLLVASLVWSAGAIVISGLNGLGHPGLSTIARLCSAVVTVFALLYWLPTRGIAGAALASLLGYSVMLIVALYWLIRKRQVSIRDCLIPRRDDIPIGRVISSLRFRLNS
ncbi:MAG TPA: oligosaccharide flippase family protein [Blastocatellia bacterium]|nr:oligosaccharide flippase family protein [Blastocatellia bacterium]